MDGMSSIDGQEENKMVLKKERQADRQRAIKEIHLCTFLKSEKIEIKSDEKKKHQKRHKERGWKGQEVKSVPWSFLLSAMLLMETQKTRGSQWCWLKLML